MTRLAAGRTTHLEREEIASETLRLFDEGKDPSIRQLAAALNVTPSAIYHHFDSRADIVQAAVDLVWSQVLNETVEDIGNPFEADPFDALLKVGIYTRRAFIRHFTIAPYMTIVPREPNLLAGGTAIFANVFERLGASGEKAGDAFHYYGSYCFGSALYAASRLNANLELKYPHPDHDEMEEARSEAGLTATSSEETRAGIDAVLELSETDPERDEALYVDGLKRILETIREG